MTYINWHASKIRNNQLSENRTFIPIDAIRVRSRHFAEVITHSHRVDKNRVVDSLENK